LLYGSHKIKSALFIQPEGLLAIDELGSADHTGDMKRVVREVCSRIGPMAVPHFAEAVLV